MELFTIFKIDDPVNFLHKLLSSIRDLGSKRKIIISLKLFSYHKILSKSTIII